MASSQTVPAGLRSLSVVRHGESGVAPIHVGVAIRSYRMQLGMTQGNVGMRTGLMRCYLSRLENGHTTPSLNTLQKIAEALGVPLSRLLPEAAGEHPQGRFLTADQVNFLTQVQLHNAQLAHADRRQLLALVRKFAATSSTSVT